MLRDHFVFLLLRLTVEIDGFLDILSLSRSYKTLHTGDMVKKDKKKFGYPF